MKKFLFLLTAVLALTVAHGQTHVYIPFPENTATWVVDYVMTSCSGYCNSEVYKMDGDTIINSVSYNKIYIQNIKFSPVGYTPLSAQQYWAGIRQDSINKKVYIIEQTMTSDTLLFDFNLTIGDTLKPSYLTNGLNQQPAIVTSIDSIFLDSKYHRTFLFNNPDTTNGEPAYLIEGVGGASDLTLISNWHTGGTPGLACFNGSGKGFFTGECSASLTTSIFESEKIFSTIAIFPNPFSRQTTLQTNNLLHNATLTVDNCFGQTVAQIKNISGQTIVFNRDNLASGLYFVRLTEENKIIAVDKLVITDK